MTGRANGYKSVEVVVGWEEESSFLDNSTDHSLASIFVSPLPSELGASLNPKRENVWHD